MYAYVQYMYVCMFEHMSISYVHVCMDLRQLFYIGLSFFARPHLWPEAACLSDFYPSAMQLHACAWKPDVAQAAALYPGCFLELIHHGPKNSLFER